VASQDNPKIVSTLGGFQGGPGQVTIPLAGSIYYQPGSFLDNLIEAYAGTHDTFNSGTWYDAQGNDKNLTGTTQAVGNITNYTNVIFATPFAASVYFTPGTWNALSALLK
jgi:filamentous hemagglutinin